MKRLLPLCIALTLLACGSAPKTPEPTPGNPVAAEPAAPQSVLILNQTSKAVLDRIQQQRTARGMKVIGRGPLRIELGQAVPKTDPPAEVRMIYQLAPGKDGLRLLARVFRIDSPGTAQEYTKEITQELADKLNDELQRYAKP